MNSYFSSKNNYSLYHYSIVYLLSANIHINLLVTKLESRTYINISIINRHVFEIKLCSFCY